MLLRPVLICCTALCPLNWNDSHPAPAVLALESDVDPGLAQRRGEPTQGFRQDRRALRPAFRLLLGFGCSSIESFQKIGSSACEAVRRRVHVCAQYDGDLIVFEYRLDCLFDVAGVGGHERALRPERALAGRHPLGEVGFRPNRSWQSNKNIQKTIFLRPSC